MSNNTWWIDPNASVSFVDRDFSDNFGQGLEPDKVGLGIEDCVVEGTVEEIRAFGIRIVNACDAFDESEWREGEDEDSTDNDVIGAPY